MLNVVYTKPFATDWYIYRPCYTVLASSVQAKIAYA